jgi:hypothetical protein
MKTFWKLITPKQFFILIFIVIVLAALTSCKSDDGNTKKELLNSTHRIAIAKHNLSIRQYMVKNKTKEVSFRVLDSIKLDTEKYCDSLINDAIIKTSSVKPVVTSMWGY